MIERLKNAFYVLVINVRLCRYIEIDLHTMFKIDINRVAVEKSVVNDKIKLKF